MKYPDTPDTSNMRKYDAFYLKQWRKNNPGKSREANRKYGDKLRVEFIEAYGGMCTCCGEKEPRFLTVEHTKGNGRAHRAEVGYGTSLLKHLKALGWPKDDYKLLCMNCNFANRYGRICPHQDKKGA